MKKTYIVPQVEVVRVATEQLIANSPVLSVYSDENSVDGAGALGREDNSISSPDIWSQEW